MTGETTPEGDPHDVHRRAHKACLNCRRRKVRCVFDDGASPDTPCQRCIRERIPCEIPRISRRGGIRNVLAGRERQRRVDQVRTEMAQSSSAVNALHKELYNVNDALAILTHVARTDHSDNSGNPVEAVDAESRTSELDDSVEEDDIYDNESIHDESANIPQISTLQQSDVVVKNVLTVDEAAALIDFFMESMAPACLLFPTDLAEKHFISSQSVLLATILCLSSRYFIQKPTSRLTRDRATELHTPLWDYCYDELRGQWWYLPEENARSTVYAMLLLTEWAPIALYFDPAQQHHLAPQAQSRNRAYTDAVRRYSRLCWLLAGQSIRISQDNGLIDNDAMLFIFLHATDHVLSCRLGRQPMLDLITPTNKLPKRVNEQCGSSEYARLDVLKIMYLANRTLYASRDKTRELVESGEFVPLLHLLHPHFDKWIQDYQHIAEDTKSWEARSVMFEYHHAMLYVFSLALVPRQHQTSSVGNLMYLHDSSHYLSMAIGAAKAVIDFVASPRNPVPIQCAPIRWMVRLMHATVFLAKCLLFPPSASQRDPPRVLITSIRTATDTMDAAAPADKHQLTTGYARLLRRVCDKLAQAAVPPSFSMAAAEARAAAARMGSVGSRDQSRKRARTQSDSQNGSATSRSGSREPQILSTVVPGGPGVSSNLGPGGPGGPGPALRPDFPIGLSIPGQQPPDPSMMASFPGEAVGTPGTQGTPASSVTPTSATHMSPPQQLQQHQHQQIVLDQHNQPSFGGKHSLEEAEPITIEPESWMYQDFGSSIDNSMGYMPTPNGVPELSPYMNLAMAIPGDGFGYFDEPDLGTKLMYMPQDR